MDLLLLIVVINIAYVSLATLRVMIVIKGHAAVASIISTAEVFVYLMGLTMVLDNLDNPWNIAAYCLGWGLGVFTGAKIEKMLALGYVVMEVVVDSIQTTLPNDLRQLGYGVTSWYADGQQGPRLVMKVLAKRNKENKLRHIILEKVPKAFLISYEPTHFNGGFFLKR
ncbi:DUF2179 domain-containing protein [Chryseomicrobium excrementi]|uniref:UPF0316 protein CQS04_07940 n=1 Tax=Chryseomicrobium excrementi TaxID=2041346 RepID=A0A2M9F0T3_9BACL|nr:DUF2179 domain-containing protein [Chryseomicrobium excrementi]PJK17073.1 DUF2179 domain-containing protein [Chryseomicrobium excrementi]